MLRINSFPKAISLKWRRPPTTVVAAAIVADETKRWPARFADFKRWAHSGATRQAPPTTATATGNQDSRKVFSMLQSLALAITCVGVGYVTGQIQQQRQRQLQLQQGEHTHVLPNGLPRTCCENNENHKHDDPFSHLTKEQKDLTRKIKRLVGPENVLDGRVADTRTLPFLKGARLGEGRALCIVTPELLQDVVDIVQLCVDADCVVVPQGRNTGLTGGSVPASETTSIKSDRRPSVVLSLTKLNRVFPIDDGKRIVCLAGTGLATLQQFLKREFPHRESHSVLGSTFLDPTTAAGVAFGSGGTQLRKGPAYTDRALYLLVTETKWGSRQVKVVNTLGVKGLEDNPEARKLASVASTADRWSRWVQQGHDRTMRYSSKEGKTLKSHDDTYGERLCDNTTTTDVNNLISRFNADTRGTFPNRSEGKVIILATVHDTFPVPKETKTFWVSFDSLETAFAFRKQVCLDNPQDLPISMEYMDNHAVEVIDRAGRVLSNTIMLVGMTSSILRYMWNIKLWVESLPLEGAPLWVDRILYFVNPVCPSGLPRPIMKMTGDYQHHVAMTVGEFGQGELDRLVKRMDAFAKERGEDKIKIYQCRNSRQEKSLSAFRFAAAPAFRTYCVGNGFQGFSVDYALPKTTGLIPPLYDERRQSTEVDLPLKRMRYSHFGCNVFHEDLAYSSKANIQQAKSALKNAVENVVGGRLPAEHGHGREYSAPPETQERWKQMDPLNVLNPGIGGLSHNFKYQ